MFDELCRERVRLHALAAHSRTKAIVRATIERYHSLLKTDTCSKAGAPAAVIIMWLLLAYADADKYDGALYRDEVMVPLAYGPFWWFEVRVDSVVGAAERGTTVISTSFVVSYW